MNASLGEGVGLGDPAGRAADPADDAEILARIYEAVHEPFREVWRRHEEDDWGPIRRALDRASRAHQQALAELETGVGAEGTGEEAAPQPGAASRYCRTVSDQVLKPLSQAIRRARLASGLRASLSAARAEAEAQARELPPQAEVPLSADALRRVDGTRSGIEARRFLARALRPIMWRRETHEVPVAGLARRHLEAVVLPRQARAFRASQRRRAVWLGRMERAFDVWIEAVLTPEGERTSGHPGRLTAAGRALQGELLAAKDDLASASGPAPDDADRRADGILKATVAVAGTFVARDASRRLHQDETAVRAEGWDRWAGESADRLELHRVLLDSNLEVASIGRRLAAAWAETMERVNGVISEVESALREGLRRAGKLTSAPEALQAELAAERRAVAEALAGPAGVLRDSRVLVAELSAAADQAVGELEALSLRVPEAVSLHEIPDAGEAVRRPNREPRHVQVREAAIQAFDTFRMERIRAIPAGMARALDRVDVEVAEVCEVSAYGYEVALAELSDALHGREAPDPGRIIAPAMNALTRAANKLPRTREVLVEASAAAGRRATTEIAEGAGRFTRRALAEGLAAELLRARSYFEGEVAGDWRRWRRRLAARQPSVASAVGAGRRRLASVGRTLGLLPPRPGGTDPDAPELASVTEVFGDLPAVYRRLFSFEPVTDPQLLSGRDHSLAEIAKLRQTWEGGGPGSLIVVSPPGAGITSFLNVVATRLPEDSPASVRRILRERERDESRLAGRLASWLGLDASGAPGEAADLDRLADRVQGAPDGTIPRTMILEGGEQLHLRAPDGGKLFERLMSFVARTESRIFWIVSLNASAWQIVRTRLRPFVSDIHCLTLAPLTADELRQAIFARHRRSGIPLQFDEPRSGRAALLRRLRRARTSQRRRQLIEADYFRRLHRASFGSVRLALLHWLRSADLKAIEGTLFVRPLTPVSSSLDMLDLDRSFALKAILDHGTLTLSEYGEVMRTPATAARHTFRSLEELRLIEPAGDGAARPATRRDTPQPAEPRYRIRPLMLGAVSQHLRSRNILH
ncbi:hypothetical protein [Candidatus Palauibacter sp.]|uniref:hypothetical protein n=1 Tax=Candidatus Palauibacter sp. TaxID=3101350 RepID=UPI003B011C4D